MFPKIKLYSKCIGKLFDEDKKNFFWFQMILRYYLVSKILFVTKILFVSKTNIRREPGTGDPFMGRGYSESI